MIRLHPQPTAAHLCPLCQDVLVVKGWWIPGMRNLAELFCTRCDHQFFGDLPSGQALYSPMLLDALTGKVVDAQNAPWFAESLRDSYARRVNQPMPFQAETFRRVKKPVLLNCLDSLYGHCLLKLLNAQYYLDHRPDVDLIVLVPRFLRWMVPEGVAAIWTLDLPLRQGNLWNDWLARRLHELIDPFKEAFLSVAFSHPHPDDFDLRRFTRIAPFDLEEWDERLRERPTVTFIWREDRVWNGPSNRLRAKARRLKSKLSRAVKVSSSPSAETRTQEGLVLQLSEFLRHDFPNLDFALVGQGHAGRLPLWIRDLRQGQIDASVERAWCERYAQSHVIIGVHGSNMLLPSAHAGGVIELLPSDRWGNLIQDLLPRARDVRDALFRIRFLPLAIDAGAVAEAASSLLRNAASVGLAYNRPWCEHTAVSTMPYEVAKKRREVLRPLGSTTTAQTGCDRPKSHEG